MKMLKRTVRSSQAEIQNALIIERERKEMEMKEVKNCSNKIAFASYVVKYWPK
jgi:hypothetical protein